MKLEEFEVMTVEEKRKFYLSLDWHPFVMSLLDETEIVEGFPKADGLRRVGEMLLGDIIYSTPTEVVPVNGNGVGRATVTYAVTFKWWDGTERTYADSADCFEGNINEEFIVFSLATAVTRAEGRALRKALKLKVCTAEEISDKAKITPHKGNATPTNDSMVTEPQIKFMNAKCKALNINVMELLNSGDERYSSVEQVSKKQCSAFITLLGEYGSGQKDIPESIVNYQENWRN